MVWMRGERGAGVREREGKGPASCISEITRAAEGGRLVNATAAKAANMKNFGAERPNEFGLP